MDLAFMYELLNKENVFIFIAGVVVGFGVVSLLEKKKKSSYETKQRGCAFADENSGYIGIYLFYKNGTLKNIGCPYKKRRRFGRDFCSRLSCVCKELE